MDIGKTIQSLREEKNLTQMELAKKMNISYSVLSRIESGSRPARDDELIAISKILNVTTDYLLGLSDIRNPYGNTNEVEEEDFDPLTEDIVIAARRDTDDDFSEEERDELRELIRIARENKKKRKQ